MPLENTLKDTPNCMVSVEGHDPSIPYGRKFLKLVCIPIPAH